MQHLIKPSLRYARRKFSMGKKSPSVSALLRKHLSKSDKNDDGFKENVLKRKREESETGESKRARKPFFGQSNVSANVLTKEESSIKEGLSSLPLCTGHDWYFERGRSESKNRARLDSRAASIIETDDEGAIIGTNRSKVSVSLDENLKELKKKVETTKRLEEKSRLLAVQAVGEHLHSTFPIISTQEAGRIYFASISTERKEAGDVVKKRKQSIEIYEVLSRHLNILQIYIRGTAFLLENRSSPLLETVQNFKTILDGFNSRTQLNTHIENKIGDVYRTALAYLDTKRDRDTIKFLLTKITSVTFMAKLQGTSNKHSLQNCSLTLPGKLEKFGAIMLELTEKKNLAELLPNEKQGLIRRQRDLIKERELRHRFQSGQIAGRKLKIEEFPDISAILEYEFGEGDRVKRGGGGLESHPKLTNDILYRAADNMTNMIDARRALLALAPEDFSISLSSCYNYTQNFRKGTLEAKRHHEGRGINVCISLHKAPDTAPIKDLVVNVHWSSANVNAILDEAAQNQCETFVDSYDAKQVVRPSDRHNLKTWRRCEYEDHTYDQSRNNAITPMSHLFLETEETHRESRLSPQLYPNTSNVLLGPPERQETVIHQKRTGKAITALRLSYYENETVFRSINELLYLLTLPQLDTYFRDPEHGKAQTIFQYHSKRNPIERVHAPEEKALAKHGPFGKVTQEPNTAEHRQVMEEMAEEVRGVFSHAKFGDNMHTFLALTEQRKLESPLVYKARSNVYSKELNIVWGINDKFEGEYAEDYQLLTNDTGSTVRTAWKDKYTTIVFDNSSPFLSHTLQPVPDYVRWYLSDGRCTTSLMNNDGTLQMALGTKILDLVFLCLRNLPPYAMRSIGVLCWCPIKEVEKSLKKKAEDMERDFNNSIEQQRWRQHPLYKEKREALEERKSNTTVPNTYLSSPPLLEEYSGDITTIPCTAKEITKLPLCSLKQVLHFHSIPTQGNKDQLVLRVLALRTGTTHLLFGRELEALEEIIKASKLAIGEQIKQNAIVGKVVYRKRTFQRDTMPSLKEMRPREGASVANQDRKGDSTPVPVEISLRNLTTIFDEIESMIKKTREVNKETSDPDNIEALTTPGTRVSVLWTKEDAMLGWKPGWYTAVVRCYNRPLDEITIEYSSEEGNRYVLSVKESVSRGSLKLLKATCDSDLYDEVTEIGAIIQVRWSKDDIKGTDWKAGWYFAEVQGFDPDEDTISIVYDKEPERVYQECVTAAISRGEIKLIKSVF
ncbi:hypothetical protein OS493_018493 [Desmophyllum pertusum]|uniref:SAP domain-containing protein n=1 Tax=Desmophyllum pertusum TaxID=174260 RepID=A0A9X0A0X8_9CNID|nr:hypothetical protein OS493_018493 [Desmophyllum pertusum]